LRSVIEYAPRVESLVLLSGGLDSAVLLAHEAQHARVHPVYVSVGLAWEHAERATVARLLRSHIFNGRLAPIATVEFTMRDVYSPAHWAIRGVPPAYDTPDEDVYLPGRNLVLLTKAAVVAATRKIHRIALGPLANNPFPDATPEFFATMSMALSLGLNHRIEVATPFASLHKEDVIKIGTQLGVPLEHTLSCMNPVENGDVLHCGLCSKCRERRDAFNAAGIVDPTRYANRSPR
jgi:7-cyano-7-deazaguanine synthase